MRFFKKLFKKQKKVNASRLSEHYRKDVFNNETLEYLAQKDFNDLIDVAKYADFGVSTAIQAAFCLGYEAKKAVRYEV